MLQMLERWRRTGTVEMTPEMVLGEKVDLLMRSTDPQRHKLCWTILKILGDDIMKNTAAYNMESQLELSEGSHKTLLLSLIYFNFPPLRRD